PNSTALTMCHDLLRLNLRNSECRYSRLSRVEANSRGQPATFSDRHSSQTYQRACGCQRVSAITPRTAPMTDPAVGDARHRADHLTRYDLSWRCLWKATRAMGYQVPVPPCGSSNLLSARQRVSC